MRRDHAGVHVEPHRAPRACRQCRTVKLRCEGGEPCRRCLEKNHSCIFDKAGNAEHGSRGERTFICPTMDINDQMSSGKSEKSDIEQYVQLYFTLFHDKWPILHQVTFSIEHEPQLLLYVVVMLGMWCSNQDTLRRKARELHQSLGSAIEEQQVCYNLSIYT